MIILKEMFCQILKLACFMITLHVPVKIKWVIGTEYYKVLAKNGDDYSEVFTDPKKAMRATLNDNATGSNRK
jgi:hypothetical protein